MDVLWFKLLSLDLCLDRFFSLKYLLNMFKMAENFRPCSLDRGHLPSFYCGVSWRKWKRSDLVSMVVSHGLVSGCAL